MHGGGPSRPVNTEETSKIYDACMQDRRVTIRVTAYKTKQASYKIRYTQYLRKIGYGKIGSKTTISNVNRHTKETGVILLQATFMNLLDRQTAVPHQLYDDG